MVIQGFGTEKAKQVDARAKAFFKSYPKEAAVLIVKDGTLYFDDDKEAATAHAKGLKQAAFQTLTPKDTVEPDPTVVAAEKAATDAKKTAPVTAATPAAEPTPPVEEKK